MISQVATECEAAQPPLDALARIAAIPLWDESIVGEQLKAELIDVDVYDQELNHFEPRTSRTVASLQDAVESARAATAKMRRAPGAAVRSTRQV